MTDRDLTYLKPFHINQEVKKKQSIGYGYQENWDGTYLERVVINKGGSFTLSLYNGVGNDSELIAQIINPQSTETFLYSCRLENGLGYTLVLEEHWKNLNRAFSVTVIYEERYTPDKREGPEDIPF